MLPVHSNYWETILPDPLHYLSTCENKTIYLRSSTGWTVELSLDIATNAHFNALSDSRNAAANTQNSRNTMKVTAE